MQKPTKFAAWLAAAFLLLSATVSVALGADPPQLDPRLLEELAASPGETSFLVFLNIQADLSAAGTLPDRAARGQYVYDTLRAVAEQSQARLRADLDAWGVPYHPFFIVNAMRVEGSEALARKLAARPEVTRVVADPTFDGLDDPPPGSPGPAAVDAVEWNISRVNADDVWGLGYTGQNIVVGSCDTGVDWDHPALVNQYRGGAGNHDYHWYDAFYEYAEPTDPHGHGTHTVGTMVGYDDGANQIGMAPGAQWIACKVNSGSTWKASKYIECWEWFLAPTRVDGSDPDPSLAPHVINNSWTCPGSEGCDPDTLRDAAKALYAAGIATIVSAGNAGSGCGTITIPAHYPELLTIGAFGASGSIAGFSSRGPATVDGGTRIKPDVAAPGVSIRSSLPGGGYGYLSGTSMSAPHTAGLVALLWSAQSALAGDLATTYEIIEASAEPTVDLQCPPNGPGGRPNNVWGWGIIDALAAVQAATDTGLGALSGAVSDSSSGAPLPGAGIEIVQADNGLSREITADASGSYSETLLAVSYEVTATLYGYLPVTASAVVISGTVTTLDLALDPAPVWTLSGSVVEQGSGTPLRATLSLLDTPVTATTDPLMGEYAVDVSEGSYVLRVSSPGYESQERPIAMQGDLTEDFALQPVGTYYVRDNTAPCGPTYDWIDITTTGQAHNLADDANKYVSLGGPTFTFYGLDYNALYLGSNGFITFGSGSNYPGGNTIPSEFPPNNAIYAFWDDLDPAYGSQGTIYTQLVDGHLFVIEFYQVEHWPHGDPETFEIVLDLDTGTILLQYLQVRDTDWTSVGIENSDGTAGLGYAFHDPAMPADALAVVFYPVTGAHPAEQGMGELEGTVTDAGTGAPIEGAAVAAVAFTGGEVLSYTTGASGTYSDTLCADWYTMTATAPGYHPSGEVRTAVVSGTLSMQDFALQPFYADLWADATGPVTATAGAYLTYTLDFGSLGPDIAPNGEAALSLSPWVEYERSSGGSYDEAERRWTWGLSDVASGYTGTATVVVQVTETVPVGEEVCSIGGFQAQGEGAPQDPDLENNTFEVCTVILETPEADLWADAIGPATATAGAYLTYTLDFGSLGPDVAPFGEAALSLSPWVEYVSSSEGSYDEVECWWTWGLSDVASGYTGTATVVVQVTELVPVGEEVCSIGGFQALGGGAPQDPDLENNTFEVCTAIEGGLHYVYLPIVVKVHGP